MTTQLSLTYDRAHIIITSEFRHRDRCRNITGSRWNPDEKHWWLEATPRAARETALAFNGTAVMKDAAFCLLEQQGIDQEAFKQTARMVDPASIEYPPSNTEPYDHQRQAFEFIRQDANGMLAMEMGTGKTKVAVDLLNHWNCKLVMIASPLSVVPVWPREFERHSVHKWWVLPLPKGNNRARTNRAINNIEMALMQPNVRLAIVVNHESLWREPFCQLLHDYNFDAVVIDESHRGKQHDGKFSRYLGTLGHIPRKLCLTGTPMPHSPLDIFSQFRFLDRNVFGPSFWQFRKRYAVMGGYNDKEVVGYQNMGDLNERFYSKAFMVKLDECMDVPEFIDEPRYFDLGVEARRHYDELSRDFVTEVNESLVTASNAMTKLLRLQQVTSGYARDESGADHMIDLAKQGLLQETLSDIGEPVVVFCRFIHDLDRIEQVCTRLGRRYGEVSGRRKDLTDQAEMPEDLDVMGVQIQAGGLGINLTRARYGIYYSVGFSLSDYLQSRARLRRKEQDRRGVFMHLIAQNTVDETVYAALEARQDLIAAVLARAEEEGRT